jgi:hypothetical protein
MNLFALAPVTWAMGRLWDKAERFPIVALRSYLRISVLVLLSVVPIIFYPAFMAGKNLGPDIWLFPAQRARPVCDMAPVAAFLAADPKRHTIMNTMNDGPELLFRTSAQVLSAPYNVKGNRDSFDFFSARDDQVARKIMERKEADMVLVCRNLPPLYAALNGKASLVVDANGHLDFLSDPQNPTLAERLVREKPPLWLKPIEIKANKDYLIYQAD